MSSDYSQARINTKLYNKYIKLNQRVQRCVAVRNSTNADLETKHRWEREKVEKERQDRWDAEARARRIREAEQREQREAAKQLREAAERQEKQQQEEWRKARQKREHEEWRQKLEQVDLWYREQKSRPQLEKPLTCADYVGHPSCRSSYVHNNQVVAQMVSIAQQGRYYTLEGREVAFDTYMVHFPIS